MDRKRRCALTKLKTLLNLLNDENDYPTCGTGDTVSREKYPTCPAMARKCTPKTDVPFESTLRKKIYPLVPYVEKPREKCFQVHECSPSTTLCLNSVVLPGTNQVHNNQLCADQFQPMRTRRYPYTQRKSPKLYLIQEDSYPDNPLGHQCQLGQRTRPLRRLQQNVIPPPKCCQSRELRGGFMYRGCDCDKTNGLQDRCLRFCCLRNPKCRTKPAACYLSRFSGGKHLPDITNRRRIPQPYRDFIDDDFDSPIYEFDDHEAELPFCNDDLEDCIVHNTCRDPYGSRQHHFVSFPSEPEPCQSLEGGMYSCCQRSPRVLKVPKVVYDSPRDSCGFEPTKVCVFCPLSYIESPNDVCDEW